MPPASPANSEWLTRKELIDQDLRKWGWKIVPFKPGQPLSSLEGCAVEEYETDNGPADYALCHGGRILGVVEAKKLTLGPQNVLTQAQRYARGIHQNGLLFGDFGVPFLYSTNGEVIWHHDVRHDLTRSRQIAEFHTPAALNELLARNFDSAIADLEQLPRSHSWLRDYQHEANAAAEAAIAQRKRHMLLAMATGTGKTVTTINLIYRLMKSGVVRRVLFLVDRRALAAQAVRAFASFEAEQGLKFDRIYETYSQRFQRGDFGEEEKFDPKLLPNSYLTNPKFGSTFVYVSTIQRLSIHVLGAQAAKAGGDETIDEDAAKLDIPIHAFDLIIADECHRGYTASQTAIWRQTLDHFDAIKLGLTATPAAHTSAYFKDVVFRYEYERAVREGHLVDYDVVKVKSNVRIQGIFLHEGEQVGVVDPESGAKKMDTLEDEREFDASKVEREITSPDSNRKILEEIRKYALEHQQHYGRFPKTLIFAVNDLPHTSHADQLVDIARDVFGEGDSFVQKITGSPTVDRPLQRIREFRNRPHPAIAVSVDMLTTGVDIPDLEYLVFLRPVKSRILFTQMIGRGTRKGDKFKDKSHFVVFDCFDGTLLQYFKDTTDATEDLPAPPTRTVAEVIEDIWQNRERAYNVRCLVKRLQRIDKEMSGNAREEFAAFIPNGDMSAFAAALPKAIRQDFSGTLKVLRDPAFQELLINYRRKPRHFYIAEGTQDTVSSEWLVKGADGQEYKPADYLKVFAEYVRTHESDIEAIGILLKTPHRWNPDALNQLRQKLATAPQRFTMDYLQKAHEVQYKKPLVDIISMVKHAANEQSPLLTAAERVEQAFATITAQKNFTTEQQQWLDRIRTHLRENLSIDQDDFESQPVFSRYGGWVRASRDFRGQLPDLIQQINLAIAA